MTEAWEYKVIQFHWNESVEDSMNLWGHRGWELVSCWSSDGWYKCVFKRRVLVASKVTG